MSNAAVFVDMDRTLADYLDGIIDDANNGRWWSTGQITAIDIYIDRVSKISFGFLNRRSRRLIGQISTASL